MEGNGGVARIPEQSIGRIDGSVDIRKREAVLERAQVVVMTPDVCHAWLMSRLSLPIIKNFVRSLSTLVMDEAHTLEGVFGSNFAFLIRRFDRCTQSSTSRRRRRIAASACRRNRHD